MARLTAIERSALWAGWADAMGFATELATESLVARRTGRSRMTSLVPWRRRVGGRAGPTVRIPSGMYSDDTQLRLATSRAIRGDGTFDVEAFAGVELPVWRSYALGAGRGSTTAASSLARSNTSWFSNFFSDARAKYVEGGGNGAAMRIQPHVWASPTPKDPSSFMTDVIRNSVCTHGHARGIVGAAFHAGVLSCALADNTVPGPTDWKNVLAELSGLQEYVDVDDTLGTLWRPTWERITGTKLSGAVAEHLDECNAYVDEIHQVVSLSDAEPHLQYCELANRLNARDPGVRGSGTLTAVLGAALAWLAGNQPVETLIGAVNELGTDTDTIATMAGAILGAGIEQAPPSGLADAVMIAREARRMEDIGRGVDVEDFRYPDLLGWNAPKTQIEAVGIGEGERLALSGLGYFNPNSEVEATSRDTEYVWQWQELTFGQSMLIKRRRRPLVLPTGNRPKLSQPASALRSEAETRTGQLELLGQERDTGNGSQAVQGKLKPPAVGRPERVGRSDQARHADDRKSEAVGVETFVDAIVRSGFEAQLIGSAFIQVSKGERGFEDAIALAALLAKELRKKHDASGRRR